MCPHFYVGSETDLRERTEQQCLSLAEFGDSAGKGTEGRDRKHRGDPTDNSLGDISKITSKVSVDAAQPQHTGVCVDMPLNETSHTPCKH